MFQFLLRCVILVRDPLVILLHDYIELLKFQQFSLENTLQSVETILEGGFNLVEASSELPINLVLKAYEQFKIDIGWLFAPLTERTIDGPVHAVGWRQRMLKLVAARLMQQWR